MNDQKDKEPVRVAWLKRDLRCADHAPLYSLSTSGRAALALYVVETGYWAEPSASPSQYNFVTECLEDLKENCRQLKIPLVILVRSHALAGFLSLSKKYQIEEIWSHQETGNNWTFERDIAVQEWAKENRIACRQEKQNHVVRGRHAWNAYRNFSKREWEPWATSPLLPAPESWTAPHFIIPSDPIPKTEDIFGEKGKGTQKGGETAGITTIKSFFEERCLVGEGYRKEIGSPLLAGQACSRLSPHITWGSLSIKTAVQTARNWEPKLKKPSPVRLGPQIQSFLTRMLWRDQFLQKFEALHWMEFLSINTQAEQNRKEDPEFIEAWATGHTGYPFVDACMRSLVATQWLNFRARAMLVSFASYGLKLPWQSFDTHLAKNFLDFEPGIHFPQVQMQAGVTYGSPPRIYNPIKQSFEKDPQGDFIRRWVPELENEPTTSIHLPNDAIMQRREKYVDQIVPSGGLWKKMQEVARKPKQKERNQMEFELG